MLQAVITGDIINSREIDPKDWLKTLKGIFSKRISKKSHWEIFRGDSFQVIVEAKDALELAFAIKAAVKQFTELDVRIAIGLGKIKYLAKKTTESNGEAFINSGDCFDNLKKRTLAIKGNQPQFNETINLLLDFATFIANHWSVVEAELIEIKLNHIEMNQNELAKLTSKSQSTISATLSRAGFTEIQQLLNYYQEQIISIEC